MQVSVTSSTDPKTVSHDAKLPMHVLMLPHGSHAFQVDHRKSNSDTNQLQVGCDLIEQRWIYRERNNNVGSIKNLDVSFYISDDIGQSSSVWIGASPVEIAMIDCCTCDDSENEAEVPPWKSGKEMVFMKSRTRLKRTRDEEDDYLPSDEEEDRKVVAQVQEVIQNRPKVVRGSLKRGREMDFLSLMTRFCNALSDRSLALAILARTIQADKDEEIVHKNKEYLHQRWKQGLFTPVNPVDNGNHVPENSTMEINNANIHQPLDIVNSDEAGETPTIESTSDQASSFEYASPGKLPIPIITTFLTCGGMKALNQWLQEAFTPTVSKTSRLTESVSTNSNKPLPTATVAMTSSTASSKKRVLSNTGSTPKVSLVPSRTCTLLPIILKLLQDMPFHKTLVYETQINKQIRKLKKILDKNNLKLQTESKGSFTLEKNCDTVFGTVPVAQVQKAVESLMATWKEALSLSNKAGTPENNEVSVPDPFSTLRLGLRERFKASFPNIPIAELSTAHVANHARAKILLKNKLEKTSNLPSSQKSSVNKIQTREEELKAVQARLDAQRKIMELHLQKMAETNHKMADEAWEQKKHDSFSSTGTARRRVTWADTSRKGMLVEVREFIVDSFNHFSSSHDFASEKREEHNYIERRRLMLQNDRPSTMHLEDEDYDDDEMFS